MKVIATDKHSSLISKSIYDKEKRLCNIYTQPVRHDIQHMNNRHNVIQHYDTQHKGLICDIQHK
jgi:hypothetical protein